MPIILRGFAAMVACTVLGATASSQSAKDIIGASPLVAIENEAPAKRINQVRRK